MSRFEGNSHFGEDYRWFGLALIIGLLIWAPALTAQTTTPEENPYPGCPHCRQMGCQHHGRGRAMRGGPSQPVMENAHFLITHHEHLQRTVGDVPGGVRTRTTTDDPELTERLREHVREMADLLEEGGRIRNWDPLFSEIFDHRDAIEIEIQDVADGVEVIETSEDEAVVALIRAHARKVEEFVARGRAACREETPLPPGYSDTGR